MLDSQTAITSRHRLGTGGGQSLRGTRVAGPIAGSGGPEALGSGAERRIDLVLNHDPSELSLGIECKCQGTGGSAEEEIPVTIQDIVAWPIPGIVVFDGAQFSANVRAYLHSTRKAAAYEDMPGWLTLFFDFSGDTGP